MSSVPDVEQAIDRLYALPLDQFTAARNALARTLKGDDAARVKRLVKPTVVPWAVNQLYWHDRPAYERLMAAGRALRRAQVAALEGGTSDLRGASAAHRAALSDAARSATRLATGTSPAADALTRMLESLSLASEPPSGQGRFTEPLQPAGFEALAGITPVAGPAAQALSAGASTPAPERPDAARRVGGAAERRRAAAAEAAARRAADARVERARRDLAQARERESRARDLAEVARQQWQRAEAALHEAQAATTAAERELKESEERRTAV